MPISYKKICEVKARELRVSLRSDWYGKSTGRLETNARDEIRTIADLSDELLTKYMPKNQKNNLDLASDWIEIMGTQMAKMIGFSDLKDGILFLEIKHPAYMQDELMLSADLIINQVNEKMGENICHTVKFVPKGRR